MYLSIGWAVVSKGSNSDTPNAARGDSLSIDGWGTLVCPLCVMIFFSPWDSMAVCRATSVDAFIAVEPIIACSLSTVSASSFGVDEDNVCEVFPWRRDEARWLGCTWLRIWRRSCPSDLVKLLEVRLLLTKRNFLLEDILCHSCVSQRRQTMQWEQVARIIYHCHYLHARRGAYLAQPPIAAHAGYSIPALALMRMGIFSSLSFQR